MRSHGHGSRTRSIPGTGGCRAGRRNGSCRSATAPAAADAQSRCFRPTRRNPTVGIPTGRQTETPLPRSGGEDDARSRRLGNRPGGGRGGDQCPGHDDGRQRPSCQGKACRATTCCGVPLVRRPGDPLEPLLSRPFRAVLIRSDTLSVPRRTGFGPAPARTVGSGKRSGGAGVCLQAQLEVADLPGAGLENPRCR